MDNVCNNHVNWVLVYDIHIDNMHINMKKAIMKECDVPICFIMNQVIYIANIKCFVK